MNNYDLENLPFDPALEAKKSVEKADKKFDPNGPETEEDAIRAEALRRLQVRRMFKARQDQTQA
jgi:hypothetical protein